MRNFLIAGLLAAVFVIFILYPKNRLSLKEGDHAADFTLSDENGKQITLPKSGKVALVFFPKAHQLSFGCKKEVCSIRDGFADLKNRGITVYGISNSSVEHMKKFVESNHLPFTLLHATPEVMEAYGVSGGWFGAKRHTILIKDGIVVGVITKVDLENHPQQIIAGFERI